MTNHEGHEDHEDYEGHENDRGLIKVDERSGERPMQSKASIVGSRFQVSVST
jgi:hypothetical protein